MKAPRSIALFLGASLIAATACDSPYFNRNDPARIHRNKGIEAFKAQKWDEAADEWAKSLAAKPEQPELYEKQAYAAAKAGRYDEAAQTMLKTVALKGNDDKERLDIHRRIASMYLQNGKIDKAEEYFKKILEQAPNDDSTMVWLAEIHSTLGGARSGAAPADLGQLEEALAYYDKALAINPENLTPTVNKRIALLKMRDHWQLKKNAADKEEAELPKRDKKGKAEAHARSVEAQAKIDELQPNLDAVSARVTEMLEKRKAAMAGDAGTPGGDGGTPGDADGGTTGEADAGMPGGAADAG